MNFLIHEIIVNKYHLIVKCYQIYSAMKTDKYKM